MQTKDEIKKNLSSISVKVGTNAASVIRELAITIRSMKKSYKLDNLVVEMNNAAQELRNLLKSSYPNLVIPSSHNNNDAKLGAQTEEEAIISPAGGEVGAAKMEAPVLLLMEIVQVAAVVSLLIEIVARVEDIVKAVAELSDLAEFQPPAKSMCDKSKQHTADSKISPDQAGTLQMI